MAITATPTTIIDIFHCFPLSAHGLIIALTLENRRLHSFAVLNQPFRPESRKVQSKTIADAATPLHATADQEMSQRAPLGEVIFARQKAATKKARVNSPMLVYSRLPHCHGTVPLIGGNANNVFSEVASGLK